ncbi:MAG: hypothetical protein MJ252_17025, partial [archaeon]|nr:hypothetical protein [archaeon]
MGSCVHSQTIKKVDINVNDSNIVYSSNEVIVNKIAKNAENSKIIQNSAELKEKESNIFIRNDTEKKLSSINEDNLGKTKQNKFIRQNIKHFTEGRNARFGFREEILKIKLKPTDNFKREPKINDIGKLSNNPKSIQT